jgi:hypothetical protein
MVTLPELPLGTQPSQINLMPKQFALSHYQPTNALIPLKHLLSLQRIATDFKELQQTRMSSD